MDTLYVIQDLSTEIIGKYQCQKVTSLTRYGIKCEMREANENNFPTLSVLRMDSPFLGLIFIVGL
jgi:hypothetical protein